MLLKSFPKVSFYKFLGHSLEILKDPLPFHRDQFAIHGDTFQLQLGFWQSCVFSRNPEFLQYVLQKNHKNYTKSEIQTRDVAKYVGKGLLTIEGDFWKKQEG